MGIAAGTAVAGTALAIYRRSCKQSAAKRAVERAGEMASLARRSLRPWAGVAISLASAVYSRRTQQKARDAMVKSQKKATDLADTGRGILRRFREASEETANRYPRLRKLIA
jgi:hypothetical protein